MAARRVLIADNVHPECDDILHDYGLEVVRAVGKSEEELAAIVPDFDAMIVRSAVKVGRSLIEKMERMQVIGRAGAGVDNIDVEAATERGILVMNTPGGNTISAAEHTVAMILAVCRRIPAANRSLLADQWDRKTFVGTELLGKTVGILGVGRIGSEVAKRLRPFGVTLLGYDPVLPEDAVEDLKLKAVDLEEMLEQSDILTLHLPLNEQTRHLIDSSRLERMKPGAYLVNCARGGIVDEAALLAALESGRLAGAAFDVFEEEPPAFPNELIHHPRFVGTPHIAASTEEAQERVALAIARQVGALLNGFEAAGLVNANGLEGALWGEFVSYSTAARKLGSVVRQLVPVDQFQGRLHAYGDDVALMMSGLRASFLTGLLEGEEIRVNPINAEIVAANRGVQVDITGKGTHDSCRFLVVAEIEGEEEFNRVAMTFFGIGEPRFVLLNDVWFDIRPEGAMLVIEHLDSPGMLAEIARLLGTCEINIVDLSLGRHSERATAFTLLRTDSIVSQECLQAIAGLPTVRNLRSLYC